MFPDGTDMLTLRNQKKHTGGAFGQVISGVVTQDSYAQIVAMQKKLAGTLKKCTFVDLPRPFDHIVIKKVPFASYLEENGSNSNTNATRNASALWKEFVKDCQIECSMHHRMASHPVARKYVPRIFFAGMDHETFVIVMQYVPGVSLDALLSKKRSNGRYVRLTREQFNLINKAVRDLHKAGFRHGDLHTGNVILDVATNQVFFIDFTTSHVMGHPYNGSMFVKNNIHSLSVLEAYVR